MGQYVRGKGGWYYSLAVIFPQALAHLRVPPSGWYDPRLHDPKDQPMRPSGRAADMLRDVSLTTGFSHHAEGSCLIRMGRTEVLCAASVETRIPPFLRNSGLGWVTAEYGMLPRATHTRGDREAARGKQSGRTQEIQRLIGRSLRAVWTGRRWARCRSPSTATC